MVQRVLSREHEELLADERRVLAELARGLARFDAAQEDQETLAAAVARLDELFLLVVAGEFNSGKSALINALVCRPVLEEGVTPTTAEIHVLRWGEEETREIAYQFWNFLVFGLAADSLRAAYRCSRSRMLAARSSPSSSSATSRMRRASSGPVSSRAVSLM